MTDTAAGGLWSAAFGRSSLSPLIFTVKPAFREKAWGALTDLGLRTETRNEDRGGSPGGHAGSQYQWSAAQLLDGYVVGLAWGNRFPNRGELPNGMWVVGVRALYVLIRLLELEPPRRQLRGVPEWDETVDLVVEAHAQVAAGEGGAGAACDITESAALLCLALDEFGEAALPSDREKYLHFLPGVGEWGELEFNRREQQEFEAAGVDMQEAVLWRELGCVSRDLVERLRPLGMDTVKAWVAIGVKPWEIGELAPFGIETVKAWIAIGVKPREIGELAPFGIETVKAWMAIGVIPGSGHLEHYLSKGYRVQDAIALIEAGCPPMGGVMAPFLAVEGGLDRLKEYLAAGLGIGEASDYLEHGVAIPEALEWKALGFPSRMVLHAVYLGWDLETARRAIQAGRTPHDIVRKSSGPPPEPT